MSAIPPIEPARPLHRALPVRERHQDGHGRNRQHPEAEEPRDEQDEAVEDDGLPHVDVRA